MKDKCWAVVNFNCFHDSNEVMYQKTLIKHILVTALSMSTTMGR